MFSTQNEIHNYAFHVVSGRKFKNDEKKKETDFAENVLNGECEMAGRIPASVLMLTIFFFYDTHSILICVTRTPGKRLVDIVNIYDDRARNVKG